MINDEISNETLKRLNNCVETRSQASSIYNACHNAFDIISTLNDADISQYQFALKFSLGYYVNSGRFSIMSPSTIDKINISI